MTGIRPRSGLTRADRALLATLSRSLPRPAWAGFPVKPETLACDFLAVETAFLQRLYVLLDRARHAADRVRRMHREPGRRLGRLRRLATLVMQLAEQQPF
jgi:hypothetical protein